MPRTDFADVPDKIHLFFLLDNSGSMSGTAIQTLNEAMVNTLHEIKNEADRREITAMIHILSFNSSISWLCGTTAEEGVIVENIVWNDIGATGGTNTAGAISSILSGLSERFLGHHAYRPIIILITDGYSDNRSNTQSAIQELNKRQKTINIAVGVSGYNPDELDDFASEGTIVYKDGLGNELNTENGKFIFPVDNAAQLAQIIADVSVSSLISSALNANQQVVSGTDTGNDSGNSNGDTITITKDPGGWIS